MNPATQSFRDYLSRLDQARELLTLSQLVSPEFELGACLSILDDGPALQFADVVGSDLPVVGNILNSRERMAAALGLGVADLEDAIAASATAPIPPRIGDQAPWQEISAPTDFGQLPVPSFFERETGPYITAGVILAQDVISGERNMSYARFKLLGQDTAMLGVSPNHHLGQMVTRATSAGRRLPIAVALGNHPAVMLAACLYLNFGDDEAASAGALLGEPLAMVPSPVHRIPVPAGSEIVFEAEVDGSELVEEGPVSEFNGLYHEYGRGFRTHFGMCSRRRDARFQVILPGLHQEHVLLGGVAIAAGLKARLRTRIPNVAAVAVPDTGAGRLSAVVALRDARPGQAQQVIMACMSDVPLIKQVVVVDDDIDVWNTKAVEWARMTRVRPERDILVIPNAKTDRSEPLQVDSTVGKLGIDGTSKPGDRKEGFGLSRAPVRALEQAAKLLGDTCADGPQQSLRSGIRGFWS
jgi:2,5-furandicarboxylate decarboxylase 1